MNPSANFNCQYLKIGLCNLFPVLLEYIHTTALWYNNNGD